METPEREGRAGGPAFLVHSGQVCADTRGMEGQATRDDDERGFTLVELMVVVLIIAILVAIAIPTFLGARDRANDRAAQSNLRFAFIAVRTYFNAESEYTGDATAMHETDPALTWTSGAPTLADNDRVVSVWASGDGMTVRIGTASRSGDCFFIRDVMSDTAAGTSYARMGTTGGVCDVPAAGDWHPTWP